LDFVLIINRNKCNRGDIIGERLINYQIFQSTENSFIISIIMVAVSLLYILPPFFHISLKFNAIPFQSNN
jgi:hypothetical protein